MESHAQPHAVRVTTRYHYLDGLRGAASLLVVIHHGLTLLDFAIYSGDPSDSHFAWDVWLSGLPFVVVNAGSFAVCIFLVLSGFVLGQSFLRTELSIVPLVVKRYVRLTVPIAAANVVAFVVLAAFSRTPLPGADMVGRTIGGLSNGFRYCLNEAFIRATLTGLQGPTYNGVLWTMYIEFWGSICLIAAFVAARAICPHPPRKVVAASSLLAAFAILTWNSYVFLMIVGAILSIAISGGQDRPRNLPEWRVWILVAVAMLLGTLPLGRSHPIMYDPLLFLFGGSFESMAAFSVSHPLLKVLGRPDWVFAPIGPFIVWHGVGAILLVAAICRSAACKHILSKPLFQWLGRISFPLYLIHAALRETWAPFLLRQGLRLGFGYGVATCLSLAGYVVLALAAATIFAALFERRSVMWAAWSANWLEARMTRGRRRALAETGR